MSIEGGGGRGVGESADDCVRVVGVDGGENGGRVVVVVVAVMVVVVVVWPWS